MPSELFPVTLVHPKTKRIRTYTPGGVPHELRTVRLGSLEDQVEVVGHEREQIEADLVLIHTVGQAIEEPQSIGVIPEELRQRTSVLPYHPAAHMIDRPRILESQWPCHEPNLPLGTRPSNPYLLF